MLKIIRSWLIKIFVIFLKVAFAVILGASIYGYERLHKVPETPDIPELWWGDGEAGKDSTSIKPFKIDVSKEILDDLRERLDNVLPFHPPLEGVEQNYGMNTKLLEQIVDYWKNEYNWTERQNFLNQYPHYTTSIQGLEIHFIHVKPKVDKNSGIRVLPLLLLHGWPGSIREFYGMIPYLTEHQKDRNIVFELVIPSLPGFGFSQATNKPGLSPIQIGLIFKKLMNRLGFEKFYVQGGDFGSIIQQYMSTLFPQNILGGHSNMCFTYKMLGNLKMWILGFIHPPWVATKEEIPLVYPLSEKVVRDILLLETGYMHIQSTKPDTIGVALRDNPVGLAAYILEKFSTWTNPKWKNLEDGGLTKKYTMDDLLDNVMIYWVTRSITTAMRLYPEAFNKAQMSLGIDEIPVTVPQACARFKYELTTFPESVLRDKFHNLQQVTLYQDGGHFAALELPDVLANDVYNFIEKLV